MINSYFRTTLNKSPLQIYPTQTKIQADKIKYRKYNLLILILNKASLKTLRLSFNAIHDHSKIFAQSLQKVSQLCEKNINLTVFLAF